MAAAAGIMAILESTYNSLDLEAILELYADDARFSAHCEFIAPPRLCFCLPCLAQDQRRAIAVDAFFYIL